MAIKEAKITAREHVDSVELYSSKKRKKITQQEIAKLRDRGHEMVRGKFENREAPGQTLEFSTLFWPGDDIETWSFEDGGIYTIPRDVAMHIANHMWYPENMYKQDEHGRPIAVIGRKNFRCAFIPLDFMDSQSLQELMPANIETVTSLIKDA